MLSGFLCSPKNFNVQTGHPFLDFSLPIIADSQRAYDEMLSTYLAFLHQVGKVWDRLDSFSKTHVIGQNSIHFFEGKLDHPNKCFFLVFLELSSFESFWLRFSEGILETIKCFWVIDFSVDTSIDLTEKFIKFALLFVEVDWFLLNKFCRCFSSSHKR